ncbi:MAG TPA: tetratricopeptide repeat protein [Actinomycetota bacterium]|jgi:Flp pilus assembly protein TadD
MYSRPPEHERASAYDLFSRGVEMLAGGHPHQAAMLLGRAKLLEPEKASIREALGRALFMAGRAGRARREFAKAVQIDPASDYAHFGLALACERTGERSRAIGHLKLAIAMRPGVEHYERALDRLAR